MPNDPTVTDEQIEAFWDIWCSYPVSRDKDGWRDRVALGLLAAERLLPKGVLGKSVDALANQCEKAEARAEKAEAERDAARAENAALRSTLSKCAEALDNGAVVSPDCSVEFMAELPREIGLHVASLTEDLVETKSQRDAARAAPSLREKAISLYRDVCEIPPAERDQPAWAIMPSDEPFVAMILAALTSAVEAGRLTERERCERIAAAIRAGESEDWL